MSTRWGEKSPILTEIAKDLWEYCIAKKRTLTGEYFPGFLNQTVDWESRNVSTEKYKQLETEHSDISVNRFIMGSSGNGLMGGQTEC